MGFGTMLRFWVCTFLFFLAGERLEVHQPRQLYHLWATACLGGEKKVSYEAKEIYKVEISSVGKEICISDKYRLSKTWLFHNFLDYLTMQDQLNFLICKALCHLDGDWNVLC